MARSRSTSTLTARDRLPVNPRRHKVQPDMRKRVATACNSCNVRRVKCSGDKPCKQCSSASRDCQYPVAVDKVTIPRAELEELRARCASLERCFRDGVVPEMAGVRRQRQFGSFASFGSPDSSGVAASLHSPAASSGGDADEQPQSPAEDGRLLQDTHGTARYLGETSGATFLDNLKQFMATIFMLPFNGPAPDPLQLAGNSFLASVGRYQTSDSRPLLAPFVDPLWLPSPAEMAVKLGELRYFIQEGGGVSGGVYFWGDLHSLPDDPSLVSGAPASTAADLVVHRKLAFFHAAFAYSSLFGLTTANSKQDGQLGETFFARAKMLLGNPLEVASYTSTDVAAMALMGLYMVEMNRRDAAYMYITTAMHISIMHGIHRGWSIDERGKRVFWTVYILDRWISCLMGRPPTILDDAIRLDLPRDVPGLPTCVGLRGNIELSRIAGHIVCNTYRIAPCTFSDGMPVAGSHVDKALHMLSDWARSLPPELQMSYETFSQDRPLCTLHMHYNQLLILTIRPLFLVAVKKAIADRYILIQLWQQYQQQLEQQPQQTPPPPPRATLGSIEEHPQIALFREVSDAARRNLGLGTWLAKITPRSKLLLPDMHAIFNAAIVLLLHQIVFVNLRTTDVKDIAFAIDAFAQEAAAGDAYATDCLKVLHDLYGLVRRLRAVMFEGMPPHHAAAAQQQHVPSPHMVATGLPSPPPLPALLVQPPQQQLPMHSPGLENPHQHRPLNQLRGPPPQPHISHGGALTPQPHQQGLSVSMAGPYDPALIATSAGMGGVLPLSMPNVSQAGGDVYSTLIDWLGDSEGVTGVYPTGYMG